MPAELDQWLQSHQYGLPTRTEIVGGGCINAATRLHFRDGRTLFVKQNTEAPDTMFSAEAAGLSALAQARALRVPHVHAVGTHFIVLEDLGQAPRHSGYWEALGVGLAQLHGKPQSHFGFTCDTYCGPTRQANTRCVDGCEFFAHCRLLPLVEHACHARLLDANARGQLETIAYDLPRWIPPMPAVLIHGDLWSGNIHCDTNGNPALIDPACYWGWAEADLAMTLLFGGFDARFYTAYAGQADLASDWRERAPLYNLYHLLNHLVLFGGSYQGQVQQVIKAFARSR